MPTSARAYVAPFHPFWVSSSILLLAANLPPPPGGQSHPSCRSTSTCSTPPGGQSHTSSPPLVAFQGERDEGRREGRLCWAQPTRRSTVTVNPRRLERPGVTWLWRMDLFKNSAAKFRVSPSWLSDYNLPMTAVYCLLSFLYAYRKFIMPWNFFHKTDMIMHVTHKWRVLNSVQFLWRILLLSLFYYFHVSSLFFFYQIIIKFWIILWLNTWFAFCHT